jgi:transposase
MAGRRLSMRRIREILRQKWALGRSHREVTQSLGISLGAVSAALARARDAGLGSWEAVLALGEVELEHHLYKNGRGSSSARPLPDWAEIHTELGKKGVTLQLLHIEYLERHYDGYAYTQFCDYYRRWRKKQKRSMRQVHRAGEKLFIDYSGKKPTIVDPKTGQVREVELFVAVFGASNYTYAEATESQKSADFIAPHVRAFEYFGGVAELLVPDQLKSGVTRACRYEPGLQSTYEEMAEHYGTTIVPARPRKPKDKAKVEVAVQIVQRWILAVLRHETFFSLAELNTRIRELLERLNDRPMRSYRASRRELFIKLDQPVLRPLPTTPFVFAERKFARVNIDYHVELEGHYYSVPHALVGEKVELRFTAGTLEVYFRGQRATSHPRNGSAHRLPGRHSTKPSHMPKSHQKHLEWTPTRFIHWAESIGPSAGELVTAILADRPHPEQGYRSCLGILRLGKQYGDARLEAACARAHRVRARSYRHVESILKNGLDRVEDRSARNKNRQPSLPLHENLRGSDYYDNHQSTEGEINDAQ